MEYSTKEERLLKDAQDQITNLKKDLLIEKVLYTNMKNVLKRRETEISGLYDIIDKLMGTSVKPCDIP